ncbi:MAG TPA: ferrochelatase [Woeseiaceae bacterium]|nr:ferrochelatase [Woeseiaceae bacterium]
MPTYQSSLAFEHGQSDVLGVLLVNLGTPEKPDARSVRRYLAEFLWDPRVVEMSRPLWWLILHGVILRIRPARSARAYRKIWTDLGSPLLLHSKAIANAVQEKLNHSLAVDVRVELGMSYGQPSIRSALDALFAAGAQRLIVLPLYPQYSGTTTGSVFDAVSTLLQQRRWVPEFRFINHYHDAPDFIDAVANSIRTHRQDNGKGDKLLFSFHGVPQKLLHDGDPYHCHCQKTARLVAEALQLGENEWQIAFQSRVGRDEWLRPYTDEVISALGKQGMAKLDVVCPGFAADCLETLEEIALQYGALFQKSGGGRIDYVPALNASEAHTAFLAQHIEEHAAGWLDTTAAASLDSGEQSRARALAMGAER